jgi:hypothetical protein
MEPDSMEFGGSLAIGLYIIFFASNPPDLVRMTLANPVLLALVIVGCVYVTIYVSNSVGVLLTLALLISITPLVEYLTMEDSVNEQPPSNTTCTSQPAKLGYEAQGVEIGVISDVMGSEACGIKCCGNARCDAYTYNVSSKNCYLKKGMLAPIESSNETYAGVVDRKEIPPAPESEARPDEMPESESEPQTNQMPVRESEPRMTRMTEPEPRMTRMTEPEPRMTRMTESEPRMTRMTEPEPRMTRMTAPTSEPRMTRMTAPTSEPRMTRMTAPTSEPRMTRMTVPRSKKISESFENPSQLGGTACNVENFTPF